jgi:protein-S-isoprenylcysteine O-methyltransferase Ste14
MNEGSVRLARRVFAIAGIYGLIVLLPLYFAEPLLAAQAPVNHPEYFYGFIGAASVFQLVYLTIARDPVRFRPLMPLAVLAKLNFFVAVAILVALGRTNPWSMAPVSVDLLLGLAFAFVWLQLAEKS